MKPATLICLAVAVAMASGIAWSAETRKPADRTVIAERKFGDVRFVIGEGKAGKWLEIYVGGTFTGSYQDFIVDEIVADPDGKHFLALSNSSKSSYAFAIIDRKGRIEASMPHGGNLHYCNRTSWGVAEWVDTSKLQATFSMQKNQMTTPATEYLQATVRGCDGTTVILARAPAPSFKATPAATNAGLRAADLRVTDENATGQNRGADFIGNTIANLRGLDPDFGGRTLMLIDGRRAAPFTTFKYTALSLPGTWTDPAVSERRSCRGTNDCSNSVDLVVNRADGSMQVLATGLVGHYIALPRSHRILACSKGNDGGIGSAKPVPTIVGLDGHNEALPSHPGLLRICARTGTGEEVLMVYTMAEAGKAWTLARVFDASGAQLAEKTFEKPGAVQFTVAGKPYSEAVPGP